MNDLFASAEVADLKARRQVRVAFVSTNSITQGEQVGVLWSWLLAQGIKIQFAHRTFQWSNDAPGKAAVHCVIVGFGLEDVKPKRLFEYADIKGAPHEVAVGNINPYLVDAPDVVLPNRRVPLSAAPSIVFGSMANDGGHLILSDADRKTLLESEPDAEKFMRMFLGGEEFLNARNRWCLWLKDVPPNEFKSLPLVSSRVNHVRKQREKSTRATTKELAKFPSLFGEIRQPTSSYLMIPRVSSERREVIPVGFFSPNVIASEQTLVVPDATLYHFGVISSTMHNAWVRAVCGRLESRYRYSNTIVYNNFPWPSEPSDAARQRIEEAAQGVLDARAQFPCTSLATLYNPETMPPALVKAHATLDRAVDAAYQPDGGAKSYANDATRVAFLFRRYAALTSML